ncbi:MAG: hypothetical protein JNL32_14825 [Candidatus Kapabacteria bacterium]|nr:hypothetical protein [Candidatus Kapabacteria bacterium]
MNQYIVEFELHNSFTEQFMSLIPEQRTKVSELMRSGRLLNYALSADRTKLWAFFVASSESEVMELISTFPLIHYMTPVVRELMFHENVMMQFPVMSLN